MKQAFLSDIGMGVQVALMAGMTLLTVVIVSQAVGAQPLHIANTISITILMIAIGTGLMASRLPFIGPALPLAISSSFIFLQPPLAAVKMGGLPLVFGMTLVTGTVQILISPLLGLLRRLLTAEIGFVVLTVVGFELTTRSLLQFLTPAEPISAGELAIGWSCFVLMYVIRLVAPSAISRFAIIIATFLGYLACFFLGLISAAARAQIAAAPWFGLPHFSFGQITFEWSLAISSVFIACVATVGIVGVVSGVQRASDPNWERPDTNQLMRCNVITGSASLISGLCGGFGLAMSTTAASILISARAIRARIGYVVAFVLILFSLCPKLAMVLLHLPKVLISAILLYAGYLLILNGIRFISGSSHHIRTAFTTIIALMFGLSYQVYMPLYEALPNALRLFAGSGLAVAFLTGVILQAFSLIREGSLKYERSTR